MRPSTFQTPSGSRPKGSMHALLVFGLVLAAAACAAPASDQTPGSSQPSQASISAPSASSEAAFPLTIADDEGTQTELAEEPQRVVSLSPANTEIVFALGAGERLVGGTDFDDYPPEAAAATDVVVQTSVLIEAIVDAEPDVILAAGNAFTPAADIVRLRGLGLPVVVVYAETLDEVLGDIELIGSVLGENESATQLTSELQLRIDDVTRAAASVDERPRVFYQLGSEPEIYGPAPGSFVADMIGLAGGEAVTTDDPAVFSIPIERLVEEDPEVIIVGDAPFGVCPDQVSARPAWRQMTAVEEGAVRPIDDTVVTRPGPRVAEGLATLAVAIHPDLRLADPPPPVTLCEE
ncbi:MAG: ABC transporter substrate-binding protein [Chloroflexi bacterium]|nr:ABC transporter substrate-binding protein [Chloroflexota bacterium]